MMNGYVNRLNGDHGQMFDATHSIVVHEQRMLFDNSSNRYENEHLNTMKISFHLARTHNLR